MYLKSFSLHWSEANQKNLSLNISLVIVDAKLIQSVPIFEIYPIYK